MTMNRSEIIEDKSNIVVLTTAPTNINSNTFIASSLCSLEDLSKSPHIAHRHVHCQFPFEQFNRFRQPLERQLLKVGIESLFFRDCGLIQLTNNIDK